VVLVICIELLGVDFDLNFDNGFDVIYDDL